MHLLLDSVPAWSVAEQRIVHCNGTGFEGGGFHAGGNWESVLVARDALYVVSGDLHFGNIALISTYVLKMEAVSFPETLIATYQTTR